MNYLQLCQEFVREWGLAGGSGPSAVTAQRGELLNVTRWIRDACLWVDNLWTDWDYHWVEYTGTIPQDSRTPTAASVTIAKWNRATFWLDKNTVTASKLTFEEWDSFRDKYEHAGASGGPSRPTIITVRPDRTLRTYPTAETTHNLSAEGWRRPKILAENGDVPLMPEQFHRIILARAAMMYGAREDAPEIIASGEAEYIDLLEKLEADQAPGLKHERSSGQDVLLVGAIPGMEE